MIRKTVVFFVALVSSISGSPCVAETPPYGGNDLVKSPGIPQEIFFVDDDDFTRFTEMRYCKCCLNSKGEYSYFRGLEITIFSPTSGYHTKAFGTMDGTDPDTVCEAHDVSNEELMFVQIYSDSNMFQGFDWIGDKGTVWASRAAANEISVMH